MNNTFNFIIINFTTMFELTRLFIRTGEIKDSMCKHIKIRKVILLYSCFLGSSRRTEISR